MRKFYKKIIIKGKDTKNDCIFLVKNNISREKEKLNYKKMVSYFLNSIKNANFAFQN